MRQGIANTSTIGCDGLFGSKKFMAAGLGSRSMREKRSHVFLFVFGVMSSDSALGIKGEKCMHASKLASQMHHGVSYSRTLFHNEMSTLLRVHGAVTETHISIN